MPMPEQWRTYNVEEVAKSQALLDRGIDIGSQARSLSDSVWAALVSQSARTVRAKLRVDIDRLYAHLTAVDLEIVDFYRVPPEPNTGPNIDPRFLLIQMEMRAGVRDTVLNHVREGAQALNDTQVRALTRATLVVSVIILLVTAANLAYDVFKDPRQPVDIQAAGSRGAGSSNWRQPYL